MDKRNGRGRCVRERYNVKITKSLGTIGWNENYIVISIKNASCSKMNSSSIVYIDHLFITHPIVKFHFKLQRYQYGILMGPTRILFVKFQLQLQAKL